MGKISRVVEKWKSSPKAEAMSQEVYVVALHDIINIIGAKVLNLDTSFLHQQLERREELLANMIGIYLSGA